MDDENTNDDQVKGEFFTAAGIAAASGFAFSVGEKSYRYIKSKEPIVVQILDSITLENESRLVLKVANQTLHGMYVENISMLKPEVFQIKFYEWKKNYSHGGTGLPPDEWMEFTWKPVNVAPGQDFYYAMGYSLPSHNEINFGEIEITFSRLDKKASDTKKYVFHIR